MTNSLSYPKFKAWYPYTAIPLAGGKLYTYETGTSDPQNTYSDVAMTVPNTNPVILDSLGEADIFYSGTIKMVLKDRNDKVIWTMDGVSPDNMWLWHRVVYDWPGCNYDECSYDGWIYP